jgi:cephalosporin-C deacetylase-like acetyl esterase
MNYAALLLFVSFLLQAQPAPKDWFAYDPGAPLDYREALLSDRGGVRTYDASFASPKGGRAPVYIVAPSRKGRFAGVVWQHGGGQNRNWFLPDAIELAKAGAVSILMDSPSNRPDEMKAPPPPDEIDSAQQEMIQVVLDARRAYDVLASRPDVDPSRIGYVGLSFGAMMGGSLAGTDKRFRTFVLICGLEGFVRHYSVSRHPAIVRLRQQLKPDDFKRLLAAMQPIDAKNYIGHASVPLLFQAALFDPGVSESDTRDYFGMAPEPKELKWYASGHDLNDPQAFTDRQRWLRERLRIR